MTRVPGGSFWVGSAKETYEREENPRFRARVASFCAAPTEVTTATYEACVAAGECAAPHGSDNKTCNSTKKERGDHPINCVDHEQARAVCAYSGGRLPTEIEWEYLARGGAEMRAYPWGSDAPDGRTCWKNNQSCPVKSYAAGAFGLYDVAGNVWEWTDDWFGPYPWPVEDGRTFVIRGGGWSRRFEKWLSPTLRNRLDPKKWGSHLGVRCVASLPGEGCPGETFADGSCQRVIEEVDCLAGEKWNGARCVRSENEPPCPAGSRLTPGRGCVRELVTGTSGGSSELDLSAVTRVRSPEFDTDCQTNQPSRPHAYRLEGGEHLARNAVGKTSGCKNRDVGVGWNSACCP